MARKSRSVGVGAVLGLELEPAPLPALSKLEARRLTDEFKRAASILWAKLLELYEGGAHTALGYPSWERYSEQELGIGSSQSYRLLDAARVARVVPQVGNEAKARPLARLLREHGKEAVIEVVQELESRHAELPPAAEITRAVAGRIAVPVPEESDRVPDLSEVFDSQPGSVYELGPHRLICGDATEPAVLAVLLGKKRASMIWTDPPYGVNYVGKTKDALTIQNDGAEGLRELLVGAWQAATPLLVESAPFYVAGPTGPTAEEFLASFREAGFRYQQQLVWEKDSMVFGRLNYQLQHEAIYHGHAPGRNAGRMTPNHFRWYGPDNATTILKAPSPAASREHPTMKPVELIIPALQNSSRKGKIVLDPFAGSGSTMVAAHLSGRRAYMVELAPRYCDVIRRRWREFEALRFDGRGRVASRPVRTS